MACAAVLEPSRDFPAWLEAQGVNAEVAQAMDSELGIRDYGVLSACVRDGLVRAELLSTARDRLPFGFYAVLRQVVKAVQGAEPHNTVTPHWDDAAASSPGDVTLGGLVDVLLALFSGLSRELLMSVRRLGVMDGPDMGVAVSSPPCAGVEHQDLIAVEEELPSEEKSQFSNHDCPMEFRNSQVQTSVTGGGGDGEQPLDEGGNSPSTEANFSPVWQEVKVESCDGEEVPCQAKFFLEEEVPLITPAWMQRQAVATVAQARRVGNDARKHSPRIVATVAAAATMANGEEHFPFTFERSLSLGRTNQSYTRGGGGVLGLGSPPGFLIENVASMRAAVAPPPDRTAKGSGYAQYQRHAVRGKHEAEGNATASSMHVYPAARGDAADDDDDNATVAAAVAAPEAMVPPEESRPYQCRQCGRQFARSDALRKHMRMHTGEKPYRCEVCLRPFAHYSNFKRHLRLHTGEKPYSCDVCGRAFSQCSSLKDHRHMHTGEKPYRCEVCDLHFSHRSILWSHRRTHAE